MIIVSQDKDVIISFDNVENLWINNLLENDNNKFEIRAETHSSNMIIGEYKTEERAKEILQEIACQYAKNNLAHSPNLELSYDNPSNYMPVYEMPNK